ncbi:unnamed protein product [Dovyalis caffra]|uniref:Uncharacterized protein n=1 Tax=Dovyalis caffra TaxID=77055 RepID=A0AAV1SWC8_9ROSI|nr:unnamed protein product [Dovyalis caffra]
MINHETVDINADLLDCATSLIQGRTSSKMKADLLKHISKILRSINLADGGGSLVATKEEPIEKSNEDLGFDLFKFCLVKIKPFDCGKKFLMDPSSSLKGYLRQKKQLGSLPAIKSINTAMNSRYSNA